ncbi:HD family hydrolase [uncultured Bartonella sp.]|uniref:HD family hydrolase n=1 Tax=uncultured Bartonella sp. TaxID=104108 RepID=UPI0025EFB8C9|nr:HD family hydrolase [uncultured Bartonella sp.]
MAEAEITKNGDARAWQRMLSGRRLDLINPSPLDVEIADIAHGLARVARWNGQTKGVHAYSVAQHSLLVEQIYRRLFGEDSADEQQLALLHDAPEYVIGDMISPFKAVMGGSYELIEERLTDAIRIRFGLPTNIRPNIIKQIKQSDRIAAFFEATTLAGFSEEEALRYFGQPGAITAQGLDLKPRPTQQIEGAFLARFNAIEQERPR